MGPGFRRDDGGPVGLRGGMKKAPHPATDARRASRATLILFLAPALLLYFAFMIYPVLRTFWNSVHTIKPQNIEAFVGLANFRELLTTDPVFWKAVGNTAIFAIIATIADVLGGLLLALCLFLRPPFAKLLRLVCQEVRVVLIQVAHRHQLDIGEAAVGQVAHPSQVAAAHELRVWCMLPRGAAPAHPPSPGRRLRSAVR